ncbi:hypothetical protein DIJ61_30425, partial [Burkholderia pseudomallei]
PPPRPAPRGGVRIPALRVRLGRAFPLPRCASRCPVPARALRRQPRPQNPPASAVRLRNRFREIPRFPRFPRPIAR